MMKSLIVAFVTFLGLAAFTSDANAIVSAREVYRAGCAQPPRHRCSPRPLPLLSPRSGCPSLPWGCWPASLLATALQY